MKGLVFFVCIVILLVLAVAIGSQNNAVISVNYLIAKSEITIATLIAVAVAVGVVVGVLAVLSSWLALRVKLIRLQTKLNRLQKE
ncbi:DUF1049 domain-containing protein [Aestuariibacter sp. GS-14]|uniref:lipopolysaccharide assembly protein LapA domain-containing protein n=1 Tax=Alteromonadaceae TaxID=72275 RepID=UPI00112912B4|nr:lipopolysaccharide assembly protein LapA domain-containing protein [Aestuariibacter sp. GS-14]TPV59910.1 DUF1049 domain-containing protein [Aestuariibacter sp. GS-14]